jgi:hypothetical protein
MNRGEIIPPVNDVVHVLLADRVTGMMREKSGIDRSGDVVDVVLGRPVIGCFVHPVVDPVCSSRSHCVPDLADKRVIDQKVQAHFATADADTADLRGLIAAIQLRVKEANRGRDNAAQVVLGAHLVLARAKQEKATQALDKLIVEIEERLYAAVAERFRLGCEHDGGVYARALPRHWRPTEPLRRAVVEGAVPASNRTSAPAVSQTLGAQ